MRVLVADDNPVFLNVLARMLTVWGYEVEVASDGLQACRILQAEDSPRLVILDWVMPGLDGIEVCRRLRQIHLHDKKYVYVVILTGKSDSGDLHTAMQAGADDYITKPFNSNELRFRLRAAQRLLDLMDQLSLAGPGTPPLPQPEAGLCMA